MSVWSTSRRQRRGVVSVDSTRSVVVLSVSTNGCVEQKADRPHAGFASRSRYAGDSGRQFLSNCPGIAELAASHDRSHFATTRSKTSNARLPEILSIQNIFPLPLSTKEIPTFPSGLDVELPSPVPFLAFGILPNYQVPRTHHLVRERNYS